jgi:hypothetical protein
MIKYTFYFILILAVAFFSINEYNKSIISPTQIEIDLLRRKFGSIQVDDKKDIFRIQNLVMKSIKHKFLKSENLEVNLILQKGYGYCYDRSFLLQKIFTYNKIPIRPVYLYYYRNGRELKFYSLFFSDINSHNLFEYRWEGKWYVMRTNALMFNLENLDDYLKSKTKEFSSEIKYVRYLNNRNSKFLSPGYIPDFYYFN